MKSKYHLNKTNVWVQLTDGSIFRLNMFSKNTKIKLSIDPKSHLFWKENLNVILDHNYKTSFLKKFNFSKK
jgi:ribosomal protein L31